MAGTRDSGKPTAFLDGLRGLAAVYVLLHHGVLWLSRGARTAYLVDPARYLPANKIVEYLLASFRFGHVAVVFFFVLSGFVIHLRYARRFADNQPLPSAEWGRFMYRRIRRLYPPLLGAILLTWVVDRIGMSHGYGIYAAKTPYAAINTSVRNDHRVTTLIGNLLFLMQSSIPPLRLQIPVWGSDGPLWSLKFEFWFYAIYPAFWPLLRRSWVWPTLVLLSFLAVNFLPQTWPVQALGALFGSMLVWWMGVLLAEVYGGRWKLPWARLAPLTVVLPAAAVYSFVYATYAELLWGLGFAGLIAGCFALQERGVRLTLLNRLKWLGDCSYTLYVIHAPLVVFAGGWLMAHSPTGALPGNPLIAFTPLLLVPVAYGLHFVLERPFAGRTSQGRSSDAIFPTEPQAATSRH